MQDQINIAKQVADYMRGNPSASNEEVLQAVGLSDKKPGPQNGDKFKCTGYHLGEKQSFIAVFQNGNLYDGDGHIVDRVYMQTMKPL